MSATEGPSVADPQTLGSHVSVAPSNSAIAAGLATIYLVWGSTYLAIRVAVETLPPLMMAGVRFVVAGTILAVIIRVATGRFRANRRQWRDNAIIGGFMLLGGNGLVCWAEQDIPSGIATLIVSLNPLFVVLADWISHLHFRDGRRGSKPNALVFVGLSLGLLGLALLVNPSFTASDAGRLDGYRVLGLVVACICWSIGSLYTRYAHDPVEPFTGSSIQMLCGGIWLVVASVLIGEPSRFDPALVSGRSIMAWAYLVVMGSLVAYTAFIWLMKHVPPSLVSTYSYVNPIVAVFLGWLILNEPVGPRIFLAAAVIIAGVATITVARSRPRADTGDYSARLPIPRDRQ